MRMRKYSIPDFANLCHVSVRYVRQAIGDGELKATTEGSETRITHEERLRWLRARPSERAAP